MVVREHCAYNQTRECFLALEIAEIDRDKAGATEAPPSFAFNSGEGTWIVPFKAAPAIETRVAVDLVFLDEQAKVVGVAESSSQISEGRSNGNVASVLALPRHTIYSSQTQPGDQLIICMAGEMAMRLDKIANPAQGESVMRPAAATPAAIETIDVGLPLAGGTSESDIGRALGSASAACIEEPRKQKYNPPVNLWSRWWSPDPRRTKREFVDDVVAFYWNGDVPSPQGVRDISPEGLYLVTEERWYPGTQLLMTLQRINPGGTYAGRALRVHARAVRWGADGVGFQFVHPNPRRVKAVATETAGLIGQKELDRFIRSLSSK